MGKEGNEKSNSTRLESLGNAGGCGRNAGHNTRLGNYARIPGTRTEFADGIPTEMRDAILNGGIKHDVPDAGKVKKRSSGAGSAVSVF